MTVWRRRRALAGAGGSCDLPAPAASAVESSPVTVTVMSALQVCHAAVLEGARRLLVDMSSPLLEEFDEVVLSADRERMLTLSRTLADWYQSGGGVGDERYYWAGRAVREIVWGRALQTVCEGLCSQGRMPAPVVLLSDGFEPAQALDVCGLLELTD